MGDVMNGSVRVLGSAALLVLVPLVARADDPAASTGPLSMAAISQKMTVVTDDLAKKETGAPVQKQQQVIVRDLDELIAALEKESERRGKRSSNRPLRPMLDSEIKEGPGGIGDLVDPRESEKDWAKLSGKERDRIIQSMSEGFPPEYRTVLERYYRRLAEEKTVRSSGEAAPPKDKDMAPSPGSTK
jgi:hypothetical protein